VESAQPTVLASASGVRSEKTNPVAGRLAIALHRVDEAARAAHDGQGAVAEAVQLVQAARLEARRHDEEVGACLDAVRAALVEPEPRLELVGPPGGQGAEVVLRVAVPGPEQHELQVPGEEAIHGAGEDVEPLLRREPADDREERGALVHGQPRLALERGLALRLSPECVRREVRR